MEEIKTSEIVKGTGANAGRSVLRNCFGEFHVPFGGNTGQHLALLPKEFNPETDEVLIAKKDARRVWIENSGDSLAVHFHEVGWHGGQWSSYCAPVDNAYRKLAAEELGLNATDCTEFVAVRTHRPPEPEKTVEPVASFDTSSVAWCVNTFMVDTRDVVATSTCDHSHTFRHHLPRDTPWYSHGEKKGPHASLLLHGCYKCGKVWCEDYAA